MNDKRCLIKIVITIFALILVVVGISYAYYSAIITGSETSQTIISNTSNLELVFSDGSGVISANDIAPEWSSSKTFSIENNGNNTAYYDILIKNVTNTFSVSGSIVYELSSEDSSVNISQTSLQSEETVIDSKIKIDALQTQVYTITVSYANLDVDQTVDLGKNFSFEIGIQSSNSGSDTMTLLSSKILGDNNSNVTSTLTVPGTSISSDSEAVLSSTEDDYGTSYYYRGSVENNYIIFANMCWRIVRITGSGDIKLVLYNYNSGSDDNPCLSSEDGNTQGYARYTGSTYSTAYNATATDNAYIGFMYGTAGSTTYAATHANTSSSTIKTNLETWYTNKLSSYSSYLADTIWCNDKSISTTAVYGTVLGYGTNQTGYTTLRRLGFNGTSYGNLYGSGASLICPNDSNGGKLSKYTVNDTTNGNGDLTYPIGLLTADEVVFAGGTYSTANKTYYLYNNSYYTFWWTMSPKYFNGTYACTFVVTKDGNTGYTYNYYSGALRPAIALISTTKVTGNGYKINPYRVVGY